MSLRTWLASRRFWPRAAGNITPPRPEWLIRYPALPEAGVAVTSESATQVSAVFGCCRLIVDSLATAQVRVYEVKQKGVREILHDDDAAYTLNWGAPIDKASDALPSQAIEEALYWSALLTGNGYAEIQRDGAGKFFALWPIESERVIPRRDENGKLYYQVVQPTSGGGQAGGWARLEPHQMFHLRGPSLLGWLGDSTVYRAAKAIGIAQASQVFAAAYFANSGSISGLLSTDKVITRDQAKAAIEEWNRVHGGAAANGIGVVGQGLKFQPINPNAQETQLVESRRFQVQEIARFFGVPTTLLADNEAWTNLSELYLGFYRNALLPWAERFDAEATRKLFPQRKPWREVKHDLTHLTLGSFKDQVAALRNAVDGGLLTRNEGRDILGKNTAGPDGDVLVVSGGMKSLEDTLDPPEPPAPTLLPPKPDAEPDEEEPEERKPPPPRRPSVNLARAAVALDRYGRRIAARRADLEKNAPDKLEANLAEERERLRPALLDECAKALGDNADGIRMRVLSMAEAVEQGEPAYLAAERLMGAA